MPRIIPGATFGAVVCAVLCVADGCLTRPVEAGNPTTKTNFTTSIPQTAIDKVDLLFDIDNSASMGDKQAYLKEAIPDLVTRLVTPNCIDAAGKTTGKSDLMGQCADPNSNAEFSPVHNLHVGIVSSSLGGRLGDQCVTTAGDPTPSPNDNKSHPGWQTLANGQYVDRHNDDQGHLLDRSSDPNDLGNYRESPLGAADPNHFLDWFPTSNPSNAGVKAAPPPATGPMPIQDQAMLNSDFQELVVGVHQFGCGIESQLETWYRFLIQPDPYGSLRTATVGKNTLAEWDGVDATILQQRADFLRPDSLVAILVLTDENDSEVDVRSFGGSGYMFMIASATPPASGGFNPPKSTSACATDPNDPACTSCAFNPSDPNCTCVPSATDPDCASGPNGAYKTWSASPPNWATDMNLRHVHQKQKYGVSVQFPIERYLIGLTSTKVPNRDGEYPPDDHGGYASSYQGLDKGNLNCTNPLFAKTLPRAPNGDVKNWNPQWTSGKPPPDPNDDLCNLAVGDRQPNLVFYAHIGGVPHELLQVDPTKTDLASQSQKTTLTADDWQLILGKDPQKYDYTGIDPHMVESYQPRTSEPVPRGRSGLADPSQVASASGQLADPISGREWITDSTTPAHQGTPVDREFACIFKLTDGATGQPKPRQCDTTATTADPTLEESCDCLPPAGGGTFTHEQVPAVCNDAKPTQQDYAKAYPTIRELLLAKLMGDQGVVSSLCPIHTTDMTPDGTDPLYGYRPAMNAIVNKLAAHLGIACLPQRLTVDLSTNQVPCLVLGTFPAGTGAPMSCTDPALGGGWKDPETDILHHFKTDQHAAWAASSNPQPPDPLTELTCELKQLTPNVDCSVKSAAGTTNGWCYKENASACPQAILFSAGVHRLSVDTQLECLEQQPNVLDSGAPGH